MKKFLIIVNALKDQNLTETKRLCRYIEEQGGHCSYLVSVDSHSGNRRVLKEDVPHGTECILVLGGDGTLIRAVRDTVSCGIPLIGINMGTLGYLCELENTEAFQAIDSILKDHYILENRMLLEGEFNQKSFISFNDIVIHRTGALSLVSLNVSVNGENLCTVKGDGVILSTPTGSTGYNLSAGGPIVDPKAELIVITPINPHNLTSKSIVIGSQDEIVVEIGSRRVQQDEMVEVSFDGDRGMRMTVGDRITVHRAVSNAQILKLSNISFLQNLRKKMQNER